jgi:hypothetical protein
MRKKTLFVFVIIALNIQWAFALTLQQITDNAIVKTRKEVNYGKFTIDLFNWYTSAIQFLNYEIEWYEWDFKLLVNNAYSSTQTGNTGFIQYLNTTNTNRLNTYNSGSVSSKERAKAKLWSNIYNNFVVARSDPNSSSPTTNIPPITTGANTWTITTRTYISVWTITTSNGKSYTIWQSNDWLYRYYQGIWKSFNSENTAKTYVEIQNRIIYTAPNWRKYWIFKINNRYYFNRDEWSITILSWVSKNDAMAYINQHNQSSAECQTAKEWKCY